ncbi:MAG: sigma-70 family RNA polymerase sigma factor [Solirubrobacterales bacterium]
MSEFVRLDEGDLDRLSDEELVAYVVAARAAGRPEAGKRAADVLAYRLQPLIEGRVAAKVPQRDRDDVVMETLESFLRSAFESKVIESVRAFTATIAKRRIADYYRARERHPDQQPLTFENAGDEGVWGEDPHTEDGTGLLAIRDVVDRVLGSRNDTHRKIIVLYGPEPLGFMNMTGSEVVEQMAADGDPVTIANVQQVWHRFRTELVEELSTGEDRMEPDG